MRQNRETHREYAMMDDDIDWDTFLREHTQKAKENAMMTDRTQMNEAALFGDEINWEHASDDFHPAFRAHYTDGDYAIRIEARDFIASASRLLMLVGLPMVLVARLLTKTTVG